MKSKFYFVAAMALSLAACTSEDDLQQNSSNQISPVSFVMETGGDFASRAIWGGTNGYTLQWEEGDLLSLYHGGAQEGFLGNMQNAIYKAKAGDSKGALEFSTQSMILPGQAIMVYPADTTFSYEGQSLYVKIPTQQTAKTNLDSIPFISEGINIADYNEAKNQGAGYGKQYPIQMRQVGTQITLKSNWVGDALDKINALVESEGIEPIKVESVTMNRNEGFNVKAEVGLRAKNEGEGTNWDKVYDPDATIDAWNQVSYVDVNNATTNGSLTSNAADLNKCEFTLLPQNHVEAEQSDNEEVAPKSLAEEKTQQEIYGGASEESSVVILTYYGSITLDKESEAVMYLEKYANDETNWLTVGAGLNMIVANTQRTAGETSTFFGEVVGTHGTVWMNADLTKLDMSAVHIKNDKHLSDVIAVHEALQPETKVTFIIDGDDENVFELSTENIEKLAANTELKLRPCRDKGEKCNTIRLTGATEVPVIDFIVEASVDVELADEETPWTWTGGERKCLWVRNMINEGTLNVADGAELVVNHGNIWDGFINNGTMNIEGEAKQSENIENNGLINIAEDAEYYVNADFTNEATALDEYGQIINNGVFGNINEGVINNYGLIVQNTANSKTFITSNQTENVDFSTPWSKSNKYGTIKLFSKDDTNYSVSNELNEGFIMIETTSAAVTTEEIGTEANYVKISGDCTAFDMVIESTNRVRFVEINSAKEVVWTSEVQSSIRGLKVNEDCKLYIPKSNSVYAGDTYLKGKIYKGGDFTNGGDFVTYFGEAADTADSENVIKWK